MAPTVHTWEAVMLFAYDLFLSYREADNGYARKILDRAKERGIRVFMAQEEIRPSEDWERRIRTALLQSREIAFLATKASLKRAWVITECAAHWLLERRVTPIIVDCTRRAIASHFMRHQAVDYGEVEEFLNELDQRRKRSELNQDGVIRDYLTRYPDLVKETLVAGTVAGSPFSTTSLFAVARQHMFIAGQNLFTLLVRNADNTKRLITEFLAADDQRKIDFLVCDPAYQPGVETWTTISDANSYLRDLEQAYEMLASWVREFRKEGLPLEARITELVAITATFVDPDSESGLCYLLLNTWQQRAGQKACFLVSKNLHQEVFLNYWENYRLAFVRGTPIGDA